VIASTIHEKPYPKVCKTPNIRKKRKTWVKNLEKGVAASWLTVICIVIGLAIGIGIGYWIALAPAPEVEARKIGVVHWWHHDEGILT